MNDTNLFKLIPMPDAFDLLSKTRDEAESGEWMARESRVHSFAKLEHSES